MSQQIDHVYEENRRFAPSAEFAKNAVAGPELYDEAKADRLAFWAKQSRELLDWHKP
ncbi:MAG: acetyl-coenzyme A synthetase N-terminal domain-containing protein, partial [Microbacterium gubbeenense]